MPNAERAFVDISKLADYCLSDTHLRGKHKARVFASVLGLTSSDAARLRQALLDAAQSSVDAVLIGEDQYGERYRLDFPMVTFAGHATVRSLWIIRENEDFPRFVSCYVL